MVEDGKYKVKCPNYEVHSDDTIEGTILFKRSGEFPNLHCNRTKCRDVYKIEQALAWFGKELVDRHCGEQYQKKAAPQDGLPEIIVTNRQLRHITEEALAALVKANDPPQFFVRGGLPSRLKIDESGRPLFEVCNQHNMLHILTRVANWIKVGKVNTAAMPPAGVIIDLLSYPSWPFSPVKAISETPVFIPGGQLVSNNGYHKESQLWIATNEKWVVPPSPTVEDVTTAK